MKARTALQFTVNIRDPRITVPHSSVRVPRCPHLPLLLGDGCSSSAGLYEDEAEDNESDATYMDKSQKGTNSHHTTKFGTPRI